jgi:hypothetical protein
MRSFRRQYLFALFFIGFGVYKALQGDWLEFALYAVVGAAFGVNGLLYEPALSGKRRPLTLLSWATILAAGLLFLYLVMNRL